MLLIVPALAQTPLQSGLVMMPLTQRMGEYLSRALIGGALAACAVYDPSLGNAAGGAGGDTTTGPGAGGSGSSDTSTTTGSDTTGTGSPTGSTTAGTTSGSTVSTGSGGGTTFTTGVTTTSASSTDTTGSTSASGGSSNGGSTAQGSGGATGGAGPATTGSGGSAGAMPNAGGAAGKGGAGAGGSAGNGASGSGQGGTMDAGVPVSPNLIDDMEDGNGVVVPVGNRDGTWFVAKDTSATCMIQPLSPSTFTMATITPPRGSSTRAARLQGQGCTVWGADIGVKPRADGVASDGGLQPVAYDASSYCGVHYFAMGSGKVIRMDIPDKYTNPAGGICNPNDTTGQTACYDHFGLPLTLTTAWTEYSILFSSLRDQGKSAISTTFHPEAIFQVEFSSRDLTGGAFDVWIDDISFIPKTNGVCP